MTAVGPNDGPRNGDKNSELRPSARHREAGAAGQQVAAAGSAGETEVL